MSALSINSLAYPEYALLGIAVVVLVTAIALAFLRGGQ
jgi:hypothetical protein